MKKNQLFPCKYTYNTLVDLSVNLNRFELANNLFEEMKARGLQADQ
jgi:pentatricopeptide repeat protein